MPTSIDLSAAPRIGLEEAKALYDQGGAVFVDVRAPEKFEEAHIPGALSISLRELARRLGEVPRERAVIFV